MNRFWEILYLKKNKHLLILFFTRQKTCSVFENFYFLRRLFRRICHQPDLTPRRPRLYCLGKCASQVSRPGRPRPSAPGPCITDTSRHCLTASRPSAPGSVFVKMCARPGGRGGAGLRPRGRSHCAPAVPLPRTQRVPSKHTATPRLAWCERKGPASHLEVKENDPRGETRAPRPHRRGGGPL